MNRAELDKKFEASGLTPTEVYSVVAGAITALEEKFPGIVDRLIVMALEVKHEFSKKNL